MLNLKTNSLTKTLASGAVAIGVLAGVGLASSPAQAGVFTLTDGVQDTECGLGSPELIWSTFRSAFVTDPCVNTSMEGNTHGVQGVNGYDNPMISYAGPGGGTFLIEYFGRGTASQTNTFMWTDSSNSFTWNNQTNIPPIFVPNIPNDFSLPPGASTTVPAVNDKLPFKFVAGDPGGFTINNGDDYNDPEPHYFATIDGTWDTTSGAVLYIGLSDRFVGNDDDAADFVVKITSIEATTPEPGTVLGLLAVGGLGALMKRKKQG